MRSAIVRISKVPGKRKASGIYFGGDNYLAQIKKMVVGETRPPTKFIDAHSVEKTDLSKYDRLFVVCEIAPGLTCRPDEFIKEHRVSGKQVTLVLAFPGMDYGGVSPEEVAEDAKRLAQYGTPDPPFKAISIVPDFISKKMCAEFASLTDTEWVRAGSRVNLSSYSVIFCPLAVNADAPKSVMRAVIAPGAIAILAGVSGAAINLHLGSSNLAPALYAIVAIAGFTGFALLTSGHRFGGKRR